MNRIFIQLFSLIALSVLLFSCSKDKAEPQNNIDDPQGVKLTLTWNVPATTADLDLNLLRGTSASALTLVDESDGTTASEMLILDNQRTDGSYVGQVEYYRGTSAVSYTLQVSGVSTSKSQTFTGSFVATDQNLNTNLIKIVKTGNTYRVDRFTSN